MRNKVFLLAFIILMIGFASSASFSSGNSFSSASNQPQASFQTYYSGSNIKDYWPALQEDTCEARQDIILQASPGGCQPAVVRSDLLAEQNVPVFCQIDALQVNPLIDIKQISNIRFSGNYPKEVVSAGFHPARAAVNTRDRLLGDPLINNIGYVVVILKKTPNEKNLSDSVKVTLTGQLEYNSGNSFGIGNTEFSLKPVSDSDWEQQKNKQSFWNGRYFIRLDEADSNYAYVSIYNGDKKIASLKLERGKTSEPIYIEGDYCQAGVSAYYGGFESSGTKARIEISDGNGVDSLDVYQGTNFLDGRCSVRKITSYGVDNAGEVLISCSGQKQFTLSLKPRFFDIENILKGNVPLKEGKDYVITIDGNKYGLDISDGLYKLNANGKDYSVEGVVNKDKIRALLVQYKAMQEQKTSGKSGFVDQPLSAEAEARFGEAVAYLRNVKASYPAEKSVDSTSSQKYGELALWEAYQLTQHGDAKEKKDATAFEILNDLVINYPDSSRIELYKTTLNKYYNLDLSNSAENVFIDNKVKSISLVSISNSSSKSSAVFSLSAPGVSGAVVPLQINEGESSGKFSSSLGSFDSIILNKVNNENEVSATVNCKSIDSAGRSTIKGTTLSLSTLSEGVFVCDKVRLNLQSIAFEKAIKIKLTPHAGRTKTVTNVTLQIGIEKRAIKLSPEKTEEMIKNLNESIKKWESISSNLGNLVKGLKAACFATSAFLTVKNLISGVDGTAIARQETMQGENGWTNKCKDMIDKKIPGSEGKIYTSLTQCFNGEKIKIEDEVKKRTEVIQKVNEKLSSIEKNYKTANGDFASGYTVDAAKSCDDLYDEMKKSDKFLSDLNVRCSDQNVPYTYTDLRELYANNLLSQRGVDTQKDTQLIKERITKNKQALENMQSDAKAGGFGFTFNAQTNARALDGRLYSITAINGVKKVGDFEVSAGEGVNLGEASSAAPLTNAIIKDKEGKTVSSGNYLIVGSKQGNQLEPTAFYKYSYVGEGAGRKLMLEKVDLTSVSDYSVNKLLLDNNVQAFRDVGSEFIGNVIQQSDRVVRYFETGPDKGLPAQVPFDVNDGWYARIKSNLGVGNQIAAYDSSGLPKNWWICNVGSNQRIDATDQCQQVIVGVNSGINVLGLGTDKSKRLVDLSQRSILEAARQRDQKKIRINNQDFDQGTPVTAFDSVQCQDFMSADDCKLLFNVCDPVICPTSRCNLGGAYPVSDVIQSGIVGSAVLCLPNAKEGVAIPVCLTGIQAGVDGFVSILKAHRDCLQESLTTGRTIGLCDQIYSVYLCEFFWRQVAPLANIVLPKLAEIAYGGTTARGGGEYLTVTAAWQNAEKSIDYFTNYYAVNSLKAFNTRDIQNAGGEFCKGFISLASTKSFKNLIEPDSPPQFNAYFESIPFSSVTVPATSQYKVYYHIFAGKDSGVYYEVYLKSPPDSSYYATAQKISVAAGFIASGNYKSEAKDFTAPEGYKELCVRINNEERCGFKEVTTSFFANYVSDKVAASEINNTDVNSESECISGSQNLGYLINGAIQPALEETVYPQASERGIVRICSSVNPGLNTDPTRFVNVGNCGEQTVFCWLDKKSVNNALSGNSSIKTNLLNSLGNEQINDYISSSGSAYPIDQAVASIKKYSADVDVKVGLPFTQASANEASKLITEIDNNFGAGLDKLVLNHHKAQVVLMKGRLKAFIAKVAITLNPIIVGAGKVTEVPRDEDGATNLADRVASGGDDSGMSASTTGAGTSVSSKVYSLKPSQGSELANVQFLYEGEVPTNIFYRSGSSSFGLAINERKEANAGTIGVAIVKSGKIEVDKNKLSSLFANNKITANEKAVLENLNGKMLSSLGFMSSLGISSGSSEVKQPSTPGSTDVYEIEKTLPEYQEAPSSAVNTGASADATQEVEKTFYPLSYFFDTTIDGSGNLVSYLYHNGKKTSIKLVLTKGTSTFTDENGKQFSYSLGITKTFSYTDENGKTQVFASLESDLTSFEGIHGVVVNIDKKQQIVDNIPLEIFDGRLINIVISNNNQAIVSFVSFTAAEDTITIPGEETSSSSSINNNNQDVPYKEDYSKRVFEFEDGSAHNDLFYKFDNEWFWSEDSKSWKDTSKYSFEWLYADWDVPQKDINFISSLKGKSFSEGLKLLIQRTLANSESKFLGIGSTPDLIISSPDRKSTLDYTGLVELKPLPSGSSVYYKLGEKGWMRSTDGKSFFILPASDGLRDMNKEEGVFSLLD